MPLLQRRSRCGVLAGAGVWQVEGPGVGLAGCAPHGQLGAVHRGRLGRVERDVVRAPARARAQRPGPAGASDARRHGVHCAQVGRGGRRH